MLFNSFQFVFFFIVVYATYLCLSHRRQNDWLLAASYFFYGSWDWRFLGLIAFTTTVDYWAAGKIHRAKLNRFKKKYLLVSILVNLTILGFFKYYNFFYDNLLALLSAMGWTLRHSWTLKVILPVGISFYTFQSMSYTIDVYRGKTNPAKSWRDYALYVSFFPQLVAGPIERSSHLLPQVEQPRTITSQFFYQGSWLILFGYFKKVFIADNLAFIVDGVFSKPLSQFSGVYLLLVIYAFAIQIYCDFSGYSDIARGVARWMGFDLMQNFRCPYFSTNPREFWKRWHISLSTWLRDYLYAPLGANQEGNLKTYRNLMITMLLGGLWHGAAWNFVLWGFYQGLLLVVYRALSSIRAAALRKNDGSRLGALQMFKMFLMFHLSCFGWILFRSNSWTQIVAYIKQMIFHFVIGPGQGLSLGGILVLFSGVLLGLDWLQERKKDEMFVLTLPLMSRVVIYTVLIMSILCFGAYGQQFIYFQF